MRGFVIRAASVLLVIGLTFAIVVIGKGDRSPADAPYLSGQGDEGTRSQNEPERTHLEPKSPTTGEHSSAALHPSRNPGAYDIAGIERAFTSGTPIDEAAALEMILTLRRDKSERAARILAHVAQSAEPNRVREQAIIGMADIPAAKTATLLRQVGDSADHPDLRYAARNALMLVQRRLPSSALGTVRVDVSGSVGVGQKLAVTVTARADVRLGKVRLGTTVSSGLEVIGERKRWRGNLEPGQEVRLEFSVRVVSPGDHYVLAKFMATDPKGGRVSYRDAVYLGARDGFGTISREPTARRARPVSEALEADDDK